MKHATDERPVSRPLSEIKAELFKALGHSGRVRILEVLRDHRHPVTVVTKGDDSREVVIGYNLAKLAPAIA